MNTNAIAPTSECSDSKDDEGKKDTSTVDVVEKVNDDDYVAISKRSESTVRVDAAWFKLWESLVAVTSMFSVIIVTFQLAFRADVSEITVCMYVFDIIYIAHIYLRFYIPYMENGKYVNDPNLIKENYMHGLFIVDIVAVIPLELFSFVLMEESNNENWEFKTRYERINRILRLYIVVSILQKHESMKLGGWTKKIRSLKYAVFVSIMVHIMTCGWFMLACPNESENYGSNERYKCQAVHAWSEKFDALIEYQRSTFQRYVRCFYWATATSTSTGYGDIAPHTPMEKWFAVVSMFSAIAILFGPILGYMASTITNADSKRAKYIHRLEVIKDHLKNKNVSAGTQKHVTRFYEHLWRRHQGIVKDNMFSELPVTFQSEISLANNKHVLDKAPLFKGVSVEFMRMVSLLIKPVTYLPKQLIVEKNQARDTLFYISKGTVEVMCPIVPTKPIKILQEGSFFGEMSLILNMPRAATCRASAFCELLVLESSDLFKLTKHFPDVGKKLNDTMSQRFQEANKYITERDNTSQQDVSTNVRFISEKPAVSYMNYVSDTHEKRDRSMSINVVQRKYFFETTSKIVKVWKVLFALLVVAFAFVHTYVLAFRTSFGNQGYGPWFGLLYIIDLLYYADIIIRLRTAISDTTGAPIVEPKLIFLAYFKSAGFWLDMASIVPIEIPYLAIADPRSRWITMTILRSNRILKIHDAFDLLKNFEMGISASIVAIRATKLALLITGITHLCASLWFFQACFGEKCGEESWVFNMGYDSSTPPLEIYATTLYWAAMTMTSTGYGDIHAHTTREELIASCTFGVGFLLFGYCLSNIAAILTNKSAPNVHFKERINSVVHFIREQKLRSKLVGRVEEYFTIMWRTDKGEAIPECQQLMPEMPNWLQLEVSYEEMHDILEQVPIFRNMDQYFLKRLASNLVTYVMVPGSVVVYRNDVGREMYMIRRGLVEVLSEDKSTVLATIGPGGFFGEIGLIFGQSRMADVRTKTYCEIVMLPRSVFDDALKMFPPIEKQFETLSRNQEILSQIKKASKVDEKKSKRIQVIEEAMKRRKSSFFHQRKQNHKDKEKGKKSQEIEIEEQIDEEMMQPYTKLNPLVWLLSRILLKYTIEPEGRFHFWLNLFTNVFSGFSILFTSWGWAFQSHTQAVSQVNYAFYCYYVVFMYLQMHVAYTNEDGVLIKHPLATFKNYISTRFCWDLVSSVPIEMIPFETISRGRDLYWWLQCNRWLNIRRMVEFLDYCENPTHASFHLFVVRIVMFIVLIIHGFACLWFKVACNGVTEVMRNGVVELVNDCKKDSWALSEGLDLRYLSWIDQYVISVYWSFQTACSVGYGDIHAHLLMEKVLALFCMIGGVVFFGYIIASVTASLSNADSARALYKSKVDAARRFLDEQKVNKQLSKRVGDYYQFWWTQNKGIDLKTLFQGLPYSLQSDIAISLYKNVLEAVPLFKGTEDGFTKMLSLCIRPMLMPKNEYIIRKGDVGEEMYFVHQGIVEIVSEHKVDPVVFETLPAGRFFGEVSTITGVPRSASVRTKSNAELFVLTKKDIEEVLSHYPKNRDQIVREAAARARHVEQMKQEAREAANRKAKEKIKITMKKCAAERKSIVSETLSQSTPVLTLLPLHEIDDRNKTDQNMLAKFKSFFVKGFAKITDTSNSIIRLDSALHLWPKLNVFLILLHFCVSTYMAAFQDFGTDLFTFNLCVDISCWFGILLKFHMSYMDEMGNEILDRELISKHYTDGAFKYDVVSNFPLWMLAFLFTDWQFMYTYMSLIQILRLKKVEDAFIKSLKRLDANVFMVRQIRSATQVAIFLQVSACLWFAIAGCSVAVDGEMKCSEHTWMEKRLIEEQHSDGGDGHDDHRRRREADEHGHGGGGGGEEEGHSVTPFMAYSDSIYWVLTTMTSTGYGDISANTNNKLEMIVASMVMIFGKMVLGLMLGNIASTQANMGMLRVLSEARFDGVMSYMRDLHMPASLRTRVINIYQYMWQRNKGFSNEGLFDHLPACMRGELSLDIIGSAMQRVPMFADCPLSFIRALCMKAQLHQHHAHEPIFRGGDIGNEMYFIKGGFVEISGCPDRKGPVILGEGEYFGEESLVEHAPRTCSARALSHVDMFALRKSDLEDVFKAYPLEALRVRSSRINVVQELD